MTEERPTPPDSTAQGGRKRTAPTIDLTATDVTPADNSTAQPAQDETQDAPPHQPSDPDSSVIWEPPPESSEPAHAAGESVAPETADVKTTATSGGAWMAALLGGLAGAVIVALLLGGLWYAGIVTPADVTGLSASSGSSTSSAQIAALEQQVTELQKRPTAAGSVSAENSSVDALAQRVGKIEAAIKSTPATASAADPALRKRVSDVENSVKTLQAALDALTHRSDEVAARVAQATDDATAAKKTATELRGDLQDVSKTAKAGASSSALDEVQKRIAGLEQQATATKDELGKVAAAAAAPDSAARLALSAAALRDAVLGGKPYADELAQVKSLGGDDKSLAPLAGFAATGVPSVKALARQLSALVPAMVKAAGAQKPAGGFLERLQANAEHLVSIRPVGAPAGDDSPAVLARVEKAAADDDIAAALADIGKLPEQARQVAADWVTRAAGRQQAVAAARRFADHAALALGSK